MKDSPPEGLAELRQQAVNSLNSLRVSNFKFIIALYLIILSLLTIVLHTGFNLMLRPLVDLLWIVGGVSLFLRSQTTHNPSRPLDLSDQTQGALSESAKKVYDLKDIPPELADNPGVQKLFEWAGGQGGWLKIGPRSQFTDQESQGAETVRISAGLAEPAPLQVGKIEQTGNVGNVGRVEYRAQLPPELASRPDIQELSGFVESQAFLPSDLYRMQKLGRLCLRS